MLVFFSALNVTKLAHTASYQFTAALLRHINLSTEAREVFLSWVSKVSPSPPGEGFGEGA